jgi:hypothetical protein
MKTHRAMLSILACLGLSACGTTGQAVLTNVANCTRHYDGAVTAGVLGGGQFVGTVKIDCGPKTPAPADPRP